MCRFLPFFFFLSFDCGHAVMGDGVPAIRFLIKIVEIVLTYQDIYVNILLRSGTTAVVFMVFFHWVTGVLSHARNLLLRHIPGYVIIWYMTLFAFWG